MTAKKPSATTTAIETLLGFDCKPLIEANRAAHQASAKAQAIDTEIRTQLTALTGIVRRRIRRALRPRYVEFEGEGWAIDHSKGAVSIFFRATVDLARSAGYTKIVFKLWVRSPVEFDHSLERIKKTLVRAEARS